MANTSNSSVRPKRRFPQATTQQHTRSKKQRITEDDLGNANDETGYDGPIDSGDDEWAESETTSSSDERLQKVMKPTKAKRSHRRNETRPEKLTYEYAKDAKADPVVLRSFSDDPKEYILPDHLALKDAFIPRIGKGEKKIRHRIGHMKKRPETSVYAYVCKRNMLRVKMIVNGKERAAIGTVRYITGCDPDLWMGGEKTGHKGVWPVGREGEGYWRQWLVKCFQYLETRRGEVKEMTASGATSVTSLVVIKEETDDSSLWDAAFGDDENNKNVEERAANNETFDANEAKTNSDTHEDDNEHDDLMDVDSGSNSVTQSNEPILANANVASKENTSVDPGWTRKAFRNPGNDCGKFNANNPSIRRFALQLKSTTITAMNSQRLE